MVRILIALLHLSCGVAALSASVLDRQGGAVTPTVDAVVAEALAIAPASPGTPAFAAAGDAWRAVLDKAGRIDRARLGLDDQVDLDLLVAHARTRLFELETIRLHEVSPASVFALRQTDSLFLRPGTRPDSAVEAAVRELRRLPAALERAKQYLKNPARTWTENALYQAYYARVLLRDYVAKAVVDSSDLKAALIAAAGEALAAVDDFERWLEADLLPRSTRWYVTV